MEAKDPARDFYMNQIQKFANKLDDTLHNLLHIADSGANEFKDIGLINIDKAGTLLEGIVAGYDSRVKFRFTVRKLKLDSQINETYILSLLKNVMIYILELEKNHTAIHSGRSYHRQPLYDNCYYIQRFSCQRNAH